MKNLKELTYSELVSIEGGGEGSHNWGVVIGFIAHSMVRAAIDVLTP